MKFESRARCFMMAGVVLTMLCTRTAAQDRIELHTPTALHPDSVFGQVGAWFSVRNLDGQVVQFADLNGRLLFVNFWATWCAPCVAEMPTILELMKAVGDEVGVLLISVDEEERDVRRFLKKHKLTAPVFFRGWPPGESTFPAPKIPATFIVDREGRIVYQHHGAANWNEENFLQQLVHWAAS